MQAKGQMPRVGGEVEVSGVDGGIAAQCHTAEQEINRRAGDACCTADVSGPGCFLEVFE
jgi:hypothetical protein